MLGTPRLSVCIPTFNMGKWVGGAVRSALALGHPHEVEVVVVDNWSADDTAQVLAVFGPQPNLRIVRSNEHLDMVGNWNRAVRLSTGAWVTLLGADDELLPTYYEHLRSELDRKS